VRVPDTGDWFGNWEHNPFVAWEIGYDTRLPRHFRAGINASLGAAYLTHSYGDTSSGGLRKILSGGLYLGFDLSIGEHRSRLSSPSEAP
jgi:hypothetical protein